MERRNTAQFALIIKKIHTAKVAASDDIPEVQLVTAQAASS